MSRILVKDGRVIDPANGINQKMDVGLSDGIVVDCEESLSSSGYEKTIDASGKIVIPGVIDIHTHLAEHITPHLGINPDKYCLSRGTTTAVDAGSTGELTFEAFREFVIKKSNTNIYAFINAESFGMIEFPQKETEEKWPELITMSDESYYDYFTNDQRTIRIIKENSNFVVGIKWAHHGPRSIRKAVDLAKKASTRIMVENHHMPESLSLLRKGDIVTHIFNKNFNENAGRIDGMTDENRSIHEEYYKAYKDGVIFDLGHGSGSFSWDVAELAIKESLPPHVISTDLWLSNVNGPVYDLPTTMSKLLYLGMGLEDVVRAVTETPAKILNKSSDLGTLNPGAVGGAVIMDQVGKRVPLIDSNGIGRNVDTILFPSTVLYQGKIIVNQ